MGYKTIYDYLSERGYDRVGDGMKSKIQEWKSWYDGYMPSFHNYTVFNGTTQVKCQRASMQLGKSVSESLANLLFNERCGIVVDDKSSQEFVDEVFDQNDLWVLLNECQESKCWAGTYCYIPYAKGVQIDRDTGELRGGDSIGINCVSALNIVPLSWENRQISEIAVASEHTHQNERYIYLQLFLIGVDGKYVVENHVFLEKKGGDGKGIYELDSYADIPRFANLPRRYTTGSALRPFVIDRLNIANNYDQDNPLGVAVFANAIDSIKLCDTIFDSLKNEFVLGKKRIMVTEDAMKITVGGTSENPIYQPTFDPSDLEFYVMKRDKENGEEEPYIRELNMTLRVDDHESALQQALNIFSSQCGLGENYFRYDQGSLATATQVISENATMFRTLKKHEIILDAVLTDLVRLILYIGKSMLGRKDIREDADIKIQFDDSIIEDTGAQRERDRQDVLSGIASRTRYLMKYYSMDEDTAREELRRAIAEQRMEVMDDG